MKIPGHGETFKKEKEKEKEIAKAKRTFTKKVHEIP